MPTQDFIIFTKAETIHEAACWAHARRKFYDIQVSASLRPHDRSLERIGALYDIEREIRGKPATCPMRSAPSSRAAADRRFANLVGKDRCTALAQVRYRGRDPLCAVTMARAHALLGRWT